MPDLPTVNVSAAQANRILAVFGSPKAYRQWLVGKVRAEVLMHESALLDEQHSADKAAALEALKSSLPDPDTTT